MSLSYRRRGQFWHVRGTIRIGQTSRRIPEQTTGCVERNAAESFGAKLRREVEAELLHGKPAVRREVTFDHAAAIYLQNHGHLSDLTRVGTLRQFFQGYMLHDITADDWQAFCRQVLPGRAGATWERHAITLRGLFAAAGVSKPKLPKSPKARQINSALDWATAGRLLEAYEPRVRPIATLACYAGLRAQEALQLTWGQVDLVSGHVRIVNPKNGRDRRVPLHPACIEALAALRRRQDRDPVFLTQDGHPWPDTRHKGGNPLRHWHGLACAQIGLTGFRWHDWRHHWATWMIRQGVDLRTLMAWGGWADMESLLRYLEADEGQVAKLRAMG